MEKTEEPIGFKQEITPRQRQAVLIVDDNADLLSLNRIILEDDFEVFTAQSGAEALAILSEIIPPDLILLDMQMEDMSGPEFLLVLEEKRPVLFEKVPVVFLTAMDKAPASKAVGFMRKPIDIDKFVEAVHRFIEMGTSRSH